ncbi:hypothetical protein [Magnetospira sp. QH-2]|uniref:hypothetical protein n=1 Tax=Magnetospira sp. (strain QH-2) TaxID=1288970 RepID=UPI0003E8196E|nr:hypothetical protein [Magnetospira sp. QH-2]CCQ72638.1 protein of unknown function [Magnetospira sp. QH-2]
MAPPKPEEIQAIRDKPLAARTHADKRRLHWAEDYGTNEDIQTETTAFYKLNSEQAAPTGHATGHAPFGADGARSEDARINRQRADHAIKSLGPDADPDHVRMVEAHYGLLPKQESKDTLGGTDGTDTFGGGDGDDSLIGGSGHDDLSEGSEVPNDQTQPAPTPEDESYFDRKTYRQAIEEQRLASWLAGGGQRIADNLSEAYDQWDPKWSDLYEIPGSMLRSFSNDIKDAIENPEDPSKTLPLALEATGLGGAFSRLPKALPDGDVLGMSGGRLALAADRYDLELSEPKAYYFDPPTWNKKAERPLPVFRNPTDTELETNLKQSKYLRVIRHTGNNDIYIWPGDEGLHADVAAKLGFIEDEVENLGYILSAEDLDDVMRYIAKGEGPLRFTL